MKFQKIKKYTFLKIKNDVQIIFKNLPPMHHARKELRSKKCVVERFQNSNFTVFEMSFTTRTLKFQRYNLRT